MATRYTVNILKQINDEKTYSNIIGAAFLHSDNKGLNFDVSALPLNGEFDVFLPDEHDGDVLSESTYYELLVQQSVQDKETGEYTGNFYTKIGSAFPHKNGKGGLKCVLDALPVQKTGNKFILRTPKEATTEE